jgi:hypothetical protein
VPVTISNPKQVNIAADGSASLDSLPKEVIFSHALNQSWFWPSVGVVLEAAIGNDSQSKEVA